MYNAPVHFTYKKNQSMFLYTCTCVYIHVHLLIILSYVKGKHTVPLRFVAPRTSCGALQDLFEKSVQ